MILAMSLGSQNRKRGGGHRLIDIPAFHHDATVEAEALNASLVSPGLRPSRRSTRMYDRHAEPRSPQARLFVFLGRTRSQIGLALFMGHEEGSWFDAPLECGYLPIFVLQTRQDFKGVEPTPTR